MRLSMISCEAGSKSCIGHTAATVLGSQTEGIYVSLEITFITIAQDEAHNIVPCIESCKGLGKHIVIDGGSQDATAELAASHGAEVLCNPFENAARQYNYALAHVKTEWAFVIDADERISPELRAGLEGMQNPPTSVAGFDIPRLNFFIGVPIRHSGWWPDLNTRLMRTSKCLYDDRPVHARVKADGEVCRLQAWLNHNTYTSIEQYVRKANAFTTFERLARAGAQASLDRRSRLRAVWLRLPGKPLTRFIYMYLLRGGFRGGRVGFDLAVLSSFYEVIVGAKMRYAERESIASASAALEPSSR